MVGDLFVLKKGNRTTRCTVQTHLLGLELRLSARHRKWTVLKYRQMAGFALSTEVSAHVELSLTELLQRADEEIGPCEGLLPNRLTLTTKGVF